MAWEGLLFVQAPSSGFGKFARMIWRSSCPLRRVGAVGAHRETCRCMAVVKLRQF